MITLLRRSLDSWLVRGFFGILTVLFVGWGIGGSLTQLFTGQPTWIAKVSGTTIEIPTFQTEFQRAVAVASRELPQGQELTQPQREQIAQQTLQRLIGQTALADELHRLRIVTPDAVVVEAARAMPAFQGQDGKFNKQVFDAVLRNNGLTEGRFMEQLRADIAQRQLLSAFATAAIAPDAEVKPLYAMEFEKRSADMAVFPFAASPEPGTPDEAVLRRWYDNHPDLYSTPEFRRIKAVELSPQSLAPEITITDADLRDAYETRKRQYTTPGKRSAEVISVPDEAKAQALAATWRDTPDWAAMQTAARQAGAAAITQDNATEVEFPDPDLARAVFAAEPNQVVGPVKGALGWFVLRVTGIVPGSETTFEQAKDTLRAQVLAAKAADLMYERANKLDQLLGNGTTLDELPSDLGLAGLTGTLDAQGRTQEGGPAPIPGATELREAIIKAAFQAAVGDPPQLTEVQTPSTGGSAYYALVVEKIIPPGVKPFEEVKDRVLADWKQDQRERAANIRATDMMTAVQAGQSFSAAAQAAGVTPQLSPLVTRNETTQAIAPELQRVMFGIKKGETTMVETPDSFVVGQLVEVTPADPGADKVGYDQAKAAVSRSVQNDVQALFADAVRLRGKPEINQKALDSIVQPH
ncbi:peptidylprolyl isomerase [Rhodopila sp.]|uniref:peptidylprolyl isomerase n=1 Tax=Rhodopila sp. TaxID=2480087 RepID=UPI002CE8AEB9|nr:peptidyl-prolyl cis-trans isomerase [Rhodopila sp.]HVZ07876.1 peptidyl-prolyl cis-trans isomerase [Rhodopila sp.]